MRRSLRSDDRPTLSRARKLVELADAGNPAAFWITPAGERHWSDCDDAEMFSRAAVVAEQIANDDAAAVAERLAASLVSGRIAR